MWLVQRTNAPQRRQRKDSARGSITGLTEAKGDGTLCRGFVTTHETYDGVRLFRGQACMVGSGVWRMQAFEKL